MEYYCEYTILIDDATWGREDYSFVADNDEDAIRIAFEHQESSTEIYDGRVRELMLDEIYDEDGKKVAFERKQ